MKHSALWIAAATVMMMASAATAADNTTVDPAAMDKRFQEMGRMMDGMPNMRGAARSDAMRGHMRLMQEQMHDMQALPSDRAGASPGKDMAQKPQSGATADVPHRMSSMEQRMEMMQRMMEQMLKQQELMLEDETG